MDNITRRFGPIVSTLAVLAAVVSLTAAPAYAAFSMFGDSFGIGPKILDVPGWDERGNDADRSTLVRPPSVKGNNTASTEGGNFVKIGKNDWICREISAAAHESLELWYQWRGDVDAESGDRGIVEYLPGSGACDVEGWVQLQDHDLTASASWSSVIAHPLPSELSDTTFRLRFRNASDKTKEHFRVDSVTVAGFIIQ